MPKYAPGPLTLRCPKCKVGEDFRSGDRVSGQGIVRVGPERESWVGPKMRRYFKRQWRVTHTKCGWSWWTTHPSAARMPLAAIGSGS